MGTHSEHFEAEDLLRHTSWIRALARSLIRDAASADDLVQDTWVAALSHRPSADRSLRPWLSTVLRNLARNSIRRRAREVSDEALAEKHAELPDPEALSQRLEWERLLTEELARLEEPFRTTVLLRFYQDLAPVEISRRQGIPGGTVRWRLKRGLDLLRGRLDRRSGGDRSAWCLALLPLARSKGIVSAGSAGSSLTLPGILAMKATVKAGAALASVLVVVTALFMTDVLPGPWFSAGNGAEPVNVSPPLAQDESVRAAPSVPVIAEAAVELMPIAAEPPPVEPEVVPEPPSTGVIEAEIVGRHGGALAGAQLREVTLEGVRDGAVSNRGGTVRLQVEAGERVRTVHVEAVQDGFASHAESVRLEGGQTVDLGTITLEPGGSLRGHVVDEQGRRLAGAVVTAGEANLLPWELEVLRFDPFEGSPVPIPLTVTDPEGAFALAGLPEGFVRLWAHAKGKLPGCTDPVEVRANWGSGSVQITVGEMEPRNRILVVVLDPTGEPVSRARLAYTHRSRALRQGSSSFSRAKDDGTFEFILAADSELDIVASDPDGRYAPTTAKGATPGEGELVLRLRPARQVRLSVYGEEGQPLERFRFSIQGGETAALPGSSLAAGSEDDATFMVPDHEFLVHVTAPLHEDRTLGPFQPDEVGTTLDAYLGLAPGLSGVVVASGDPVEGATVALHLLVLGGSVVERNGFPCWVHPRAEETARTDEEGHFLLSVSKAGEYLVRAEAKGFAPAEWGPIALEPQVKPPWAELNLGEGGAIEGRVIAPSGVDPTGTVVALDRGDGRPRTVRVGLDGRFEFVQLTPGAWRVEVRAEEILEEITMITWRSEAVPWSFEGNCQVREGMTTWVDLRLPDEG